MASLVAPAPRSIVRRPSPALRPFVKTLWAFDSARGPAGPGGGRERVLPTGDMHVVVRLSPAPLVLYDDEHGRGARSVGTSVVGGARSTFYVRDVSAPSRSIGAQLRPGAAMLLFGAPAGALAERHTSLDDLWGAEAERVRDRLASAATLEGALDAFEATLVARLPRVRAIHPAVAEALARFETDPVVPIRDVVDQTGYSHRRFIELFRDAVGLAPKLWARVARFQRAAALLGRRSDLSATACDAGYADQAHLTREFAAIAGVSPASYRRLDVPSNHVPIVLSKADSRR